MTGADSISVEVNVPNLAVEVSFMRMHMDNKAAEAKGGTATKSVDISKAFNSGTDIPALEKAATEKARPMRTTTCLRHLSRL